MAVTNLTGYTWVGNETLSSVGSPFTWQSSSTDQLSLDFTSNGNNYTAFGNYYVTKPFRHQFIGYDSTNAYDYVLGWMDEAYKTVLFTGGSDVTNTTLISWLESNGTLTLPEPSGYEVTFVTNGGTNVTKLEDVEELPTPLSTTTKANNIFVGWFYDSGFEVQAFSGDVISSNITLYAKWYANMSDFYQDVADEIRIKNGETNPIKHTDFAYKIKTLPIGGGSLEFTDDLELAQKAKEVFAMSDKVNNLNNAWQDMKNSETVLFDIPLALAAPNQEMGGMTVDLYVGTNGQLQALYDACANGTISPQDVYFVNNAATYYLGDVSGDVGFPIPIYVFGDFDANDSTPFLISDLTSLEMGLGLVLAKVVNVSIPNNNIVIQQGFEFENESGIIIPNSVTSIGRAAFENWSSNNQPLVIPNSVTYIGRWAFDGWSSNNQPLVIPDSVTEIGYGVFNGWSSNNQPLVIPNSVTYIDEMALDGWSSNNQPLVIPNSVTSIGYGAFQNWSSNDQPLVIPNSVTDIGYFAFQNWHSNNQPLVIPNSVTDIGDSAFSGWSLVPYVEIQAITPPTLGDDAFNNQNNAPIYVPDASLNAYKNATNWSALSSRIFPISEKP